MGTASMQMSWCKACVAIKDSTTVGLAKVNSRDFKLHGVDELAMEALLELHDRSKKDADALSCSCRSRFRLWRAASADGCGRDCTIAATSSPADVSHVFTCGAFAGAASERSTMAGGSMTLSSSASAQAPSRASSSIYSRTSPSELDPAVLVVAHNFFDLTELEKNHSDSLFIHVGDTLEAETVPRGFGSMLVDLFANGSVLLELQEAATWRRMGKMVAQGGRVMVNCGKGCVEVEEEGMDGKAVKEGTLRAMVVAFERGWCW